MPSLEINATQPWLIAPNDNVSESTRRLAVMNLALRDTQRDLLSGEIEIGKSLVAT